MWNCISCGGLSEEDIMCEDCQGYDNNPDKPDEAEEDQDLYEDYPGQYIKE